MLANPQLVPTGKNWAVASRAQAITLNIPLVIQVLETGGYYAEGDGGGASFMRVAGPVSDGASFQSNDGAYWEIIGPVYNDKQFGTYGDDSHDDTTAIQNALNILAPGVVMKFGQGPYKITDTLNYGDGTTLAVSSFGMNATVLWGGETSYINALIDTSDPFYGSMNFGTHFKWYGAAGGTMFKVNGPIFGGRWIGALVLDGQALYDGATGAANCYQAYSAGFFTIDTIVAVNWQASGMGVLWDTLNSTGISGNANNVLSGGNRIGKIFSYSPYGHNGVCVKFDGYAAAGGQDFTVSQIGLIQCGISGNNAIGVMLGYVDDVYIEQIVNTVYGSISGNPYGVFLLGFSTPFEVPARVRITKAAVGQGISVGGGSNAQVIIDEYEMDDAATLPSVNGLFIKFISRTGNAQDQMAFPSTGLLKTRAYGSGEGWQGLDNSNNVIWSLTREGSGMRITSIANMEFEPVGYLVSAKLQSSASYANDAAAAAGGVPVGGLYRNGSVVQIRIT